MAENAADDGDIDPSSDHLNANGVPERVRRYPLLFDRWHFFCGFSDILSELEAGAGLAERPSVAVDEHRLVVAAGLPFQ